MKLSLRSRIIVGVVLLALAAGLFIWIISNGSKNTTSNPPPGTVTTSTAPTATPIPTVRPGDTETVIDIATTDPVLPYLSPGVHVDVFQLISNGNGGFSAHLLASDLVVLGIQSTGLSGTTPPVVATAVPTALPPGETDSGPAATPPPPPSAGLVVDVPASEEGDLLPAQNGSVNIAYAIVGTGAKPAQTPVPTAVPTAVATPTVTPTPSPTGTATPASTS